MTVLKTMSTTNFFL